MSYCRFMDKELWNLIQLSSHPSEQEGEYIESIHGSNVYVFGTEDHQGELAWECCACSIATPIVLEGGQSIKGSTYTKTRREMVAHLKKHISIRELVPKAALDRLMQEIETEEPL